MFDDFFNAEKREQAGEIYRRLEAAAETGQWPRTAVQETADYNAPFRTLIAAMLSARTREEDTRKATDNLFRLADSPQAMGQLSSTQLLAAIRPVTYAEAKVEYIQGICKALIDEHGGDVPRTLNELTALPGVGWKTAVLVRWIVFGLADEICVDVHVARIGKRLGLVNSGIKQPQKVSHELMQVVPERLWGPWNPLMVRFGRAVCYPTRPNCAGCPLNDLCPKIGV